jgi:hypothetical protein
VAKNGLSFHSSVFYQATLEDSQLRPTYCTVSSRHVLERTVLMPTAVHGNTFMLHCTP